MGIRVKKTRDQLLAEIEAQEKALAAKKAKLLAKPTSLTKTSLGMQAVIDAVESAMKQNDVSVLNVIEAIAKLKRAGLTIEKTKKKETASAV